MIVWDLFGLIYTLERFATRTWELYNKNNSLARDLYLVTLMIHWGVILENEAKFLKRAIRSNVLMETHTETVNKDL